MTLSEYTQPILSQTLNPTHPEEPPIVGPLMARNTPQQFPGSNLCRALTIQSTVTHQWNKDSFIGHNVRMAAKACSAEQVVQEASEVSPVSESRLLVLLAIRK